MLTCPLGSPRAASELVAGVLLKPAPVGDMRQPLRQHHRTWVTRGMNPILLALLISAAPLVPQATPALARTSEAPAAEDEEDLFDERLREFGYWSGAALGCVAEARRTEFERRALETYSRIARLFGTDRAFFYAAAFGHGMAIEVDNSRCAELLEKLEQSTVMQAQPRPAKR